MFHSLLRTTITMIVIIIIFKILEYWKNIKISGYTVLGLILILLHQTQDINASLWSIYGLVASVAGIFILVLDVIKGERSK